MSMKYLFNNIEKEIDFLLQDFEPYELPDKRIKQILGCQLTKDKVIIKVLEDIYKARQRGINIEELKYLKEN